MKVSAALVVCWTVLHDETVMVVEGGATPIFGFHVDTPDTLHAIFITAEKPACLRQALSRGKHRSSCFRRLAPMGRRTSFNTEVNEARRPILQRACNTTKLEGQSVYNLYPSELKRKASHSAPSHSCSCCSVHGMEGRSHGSVALPGLFGSSDRCQGVFSPGPLAACRKTHRRAQGSCRFQVLRPEIHPSFPDRHLRSCFCIFFTLKKTMQGRM